MVDVIVRNTKRYVETFSQVIDTFIDPTTLSVEHHDHRDFLMDEVRRNAQTRGKIEPAFPHMLTRR